MLWLVISTIATCTFASTADISSRECLRVPDDPAGSTCSSAGANTKVGLSILQKVPVTISGNKCQQWCATDSVEWSGKCTWKKCKRCSSCKISWCYQMSKCFENVWPSSSYFPWSAELTKLCVKGTLEGSRFRPSPGNIIGIRSPPGALAPPFPGWSDLLEQCMSLRNCLGPELNNTDLIAYVQAFGPAGTEACPLSPQMHFSSEQCMCYAAAKDACEALAATGFTGYTMTRCFRSMACSWHDGDGGRYCPAPAGSQGLQFNSYCRTPKIRAITRALAAIENTTTTSTGISLLQPTQLIERALLPQQCRRNSTTLDGSNNGKSIA